LFVLQLCNVLCIHSRV